MNKSYHTSVYVEIMGMRHDNDEEYLYFDAMSMVTPRSFPKRPYSRVRDSLAIFTLIFLLLLNNIEVQK